MVAVDQVSQEVLNPLIGGAYFRTVFIVIPYEIFSFKTHRSNINPHCPLKRPSIIFRKSGCSQSKKLASVLNQNGSFSIILSPTEVTVSQL